MRCCHPKAGRTGNSVCNEGIFGCCGERPGALGAKGQILHPHQGFAAGGRVHPSNVGSLGDGKTPGQGWHERRRAVWPEPRLQVVMSAGREPVSLQYVSQPQYAFRPAAVRSGRPKSGPGRRVMVTRSRYGAIGCGMGPRIRRRGFFDAAEKRRAPTGRSGPDLHIRGWSKGPRHGAALGKTSRAGRWRRLCVPRGAAGRVSL